MQYSIGINQKKIIDSGLDIDIVDASIIDFVSRFITSKKAKKIFVEQKIYYWISYDYVKNEMPILRLKKDSVYRRFKKLIDQSVLEAHPENFKLNKAFFATTELFDSLFFSGTYGDSSLGGTDQNPDVPTDQKPIYHNTNTDHSNKDHTLVNSATHVLTIYNLICKKYDPKCIGSKLTKKRISLVKNCLDEFNKTYTGRDFFKAIEYTFEYKAKEWISDPMMWKHFELKTLLAPSHFIDYIEQALKNKGVPPKRPMNQKPEEQKIVAKSIFKPEDNGTTIDTDPV